MPSETTAKEKIALYSCPGCGSTMVFDPAGQQLKCGMCDRTESIESADRREARQASNHVEMDLFTCPNCGGTVHAMNTTAASFCSYCGSSVMLNQTRSEVTPPDTIAPFRITRDQCF
jgi:ribosomal protein S27AE